MGVFDHNGLVNFTTSAELRFVRSREAELGDMWDISIIKASFEMSCTVKMRFLRRARGWLNAQIVRSTRRRTAEKCNTLTVTH